MEIWKESEGIELVCHVKRFDHTTSSMFHWHGNYEICQPVNAACNFLVDGTMIQAAAGDLIVIAPQIIHRFLPIHPNTNVRILQFPLRALLQTGASVVALQTHIPNHVLEKAGLTQAINALLALMEQEKQVSVGQKNTLLQSLVTSMHFLLQKHFPVSQTTPSRKDSDLFFRAVAHINAHFTDESITTQQLAKQLSVCREKLATVFAQYAGISLKLYIHTLRINYANQLLLDGLDIGAAAYACGFGSIRTFNNAYRSIQGTTPSEYLKSCAVRS